MLDYLIVAFICYLVFKPFEPFDGNDAGSAAEHQFWQTMDLTEPWGKM